MDSYDAWMLAAADESAEERYLADDYEPEFKTFWVWWESDKEWCEDSIGVEARDAEEAIEIAQGMINRGEADVPEDAVITGVNDL